MLDGEALRVVAARRRAGAAGVVEVDLSLANVGSAGILPALFAGILPALFAFLRARRPRSGKGDVELRLVDDQVPLGDRQFASQ